MQKVVKNATLRKLYLKTNNMAQQTALQQLIEFIELNIDDNDFIKHQVLEKADELLEIEKELACEFAKEYINGASYDTLKDYYDEKFNINDINTNESKSKLLIAAIPLIKYLNENHHPHTMIIVEHTKVELYEAQQVEITKEYLVD